MSNYLIAQSGGPTCAINSSLAGIVSALKKNHGNSKIWGSVHGIMGVLSEHYTDMSDYSDELISRIRTAPAMHLGSCRYRLKDYRENPEANDYIKIFSEFERLDIAAFFYIGGNDSMDTVVKLAEYARENGKKTKIIGVPKTIDNDLMVTDHTPGFGSAAKFVANAIREIAYDVHIYNVPSVTIVEVMGRDAGWLTASSALARNDFYSAPDLIYLPEVAFDMDSFERDVKECLKVRRNVVVAVSEGIRDKNGEYIAAGSLDAFGHKQLCGVGKVLENFVAEKICSKARSIELNILQRCCGHIASLSDLDEAFALGEKAAQLSDSDLTGIMTCLKRNDTTPYSCRIEYTDASNVANLIKYVPREWINDAGNDVTNDIIEYMRPLINGEADILYSDGLVSYPTQA